ncbi:MAG: glucose-6-phosphate dehydrogenase [Kiritimatiellia bacterium]|jgi:glucose-6-phosphate 1-dehydrogenase|nr:glucose-6-phosphate dehydrogenase [Kiritimatiellia bacterium]
MSNEIPQAEATTIVIFGATGDLTQRKLIPALFHNRKKGRLWDRTRIVGVARRDWSDDFFREHLREGVRRYGGPFDEKAWAEFAPRIRYVRGDLEVPEDYHEVDRRLREIEGKPANRLYYLATAPEFYGPACDYLAAANMTAETEGWRRIIIEKPFGHDLASAVALNHRVHQSFREHQVYRIDHYLGKETAQNILFLRFANTLFEPVWNRRYISNIQITVAEDVDVGTRGGYYDQAGVVRDMFQNHLLQLLSLVTMEPPASLDANAVRNEKAKVLGNIRAIRLEDAVRGQYEGYREAERVAPNSQTPTYAALKLHIDNWRWQGVPFYLRSGKAMAARGSSIIVEFQAPPDVMFGLAQNQSFTPNMLSICIQPEEGVHLRFETKVPDTIAESRSANMDFSYRKAFPDIVLPDAYERLLLDAIKGDASLFARADGIEIAWRLIDPILAGWEEHPERSPLHIYPRKSWGPAAADELLARDEHEWRLGCGEDGCWI